MHPSTLFGLHAGESPNWSDLQIIDESKQTMEENKRVCRKVTQLWQSLPHFQLNTHTPTVAMQRLFALTKGPAFHYMVHLQVLWAVSSVIPQWHLTFRSTQEESVRTDARKSCVNVTDKRICRVLKLFVNNGISDIAQLMMLTGSSEGSGRNSASSPKIKSGGNSGYRALNMISPAN